MGDINIYVNEKSCDTGPRLFERMNKQAITYGRLFRAS